MSLCIKTAEVADNTNTCSNNSGIAIQNADSSSGLYITSDQESKEQANRGDPKVSIYLCICVYFINRGAMCQRMNGIDLNGVLSTPYCDVHSYSWVIVYVVSTLKCILQRRKIL